MIGQSPTALDRIFRERQFLRVQASVDRLDDETYETASMLGLDSPQVRYLEWVREQVPRWMAEAEERGRALRAEQ